MTTYLPSLKEAPLILAIASAASEAANFAKSSELNASNEATDC